MVEAKELVMMCFRDVTCKRVAYNLGFVGLVVRQPPAGLEE